MRAFSKFLILLFCLVALAPMVWHGISSLKPAAELTAIPPTYVPLQPTLHNYLELFQRRPFGRYYLNSFVVASMATLLCLGSGSLAAYAIARSPSRALISSALLVAAFFPPVIFLFPLYELIRRVMLMNHPWALILPYAALNLPFTIWLLADYFRQIPYELEEAAVMDGLSRFQSYRKIILPLAGPALVTTGILVFIFSWNEFMFALTFMNRETAKTMTVGIATLSGAFTYEIPWGLLAAGVVASSAPLIFLAMVFQRRIVEGLTAGALK
ncbi:MAG: carbohydrate ABC transporter permease [Acidobacteria bacterium]|nr:carbohydrate ABC transporter permease [Acidobacteriota bacterium]